MKRYKWNFFNKTKGINLKAENLISRGGGYSYVAASFKKETLSLGMKNFNRILDFDEKNKTIKVESGITIIELLNFTLKYNISIEQIKENINKNYENACVYIKA